MITALGLDSCADTLIGTATGGFFRGISGGERRRTSIGVELITEPALVLLDEPTSGLDSWTALRIGHILKRLAE